MKIHSTKFAVINLFPLILCNMNIYYDLFASLQPIDLGPFPCTSYICNTINGNLAVDPQPNDGIRISNASALYINLCSNL